MQLWYAAEQEYHQQQDFDDVSENNLFNKINQTEKSRRDFCERLEKQVEKQDQEMTKILKKEIQERFKKQEKQMMKMLQNQNEIKAAILQNQRERFNKQEKQNPWGTSSSDNFSQKPWPTQTMSLSRGKPQAHQLRQPQQKPTHLVSKAATGLLSKLISFQSNNRKSLTQKNSNRLCPVASAVASSGSFFRSPPDD